jgi:hypothetical protein
VDVPGNISPGPTGNLGNGGAGDFPNGSQQLYLSSVTMAGWAIPGASVMLFQDGVKAGTVTASSDGSFKYTFANIERGSYDFGALAVDSKGRQSAMYNTPFFVGQGTQNDISGVVIAPTLALSSDAIQAADPLSATGYATANSTVQLSVEAQGSVASPRTYFATSTASGAWSIAVDTAPFAKGTYAVEAQATRADGSKSGRSKISPLQVGTGSKNPTGTCTNRSDLNCDGKVNLIDFSILLTFWNTDDAHADINQDGKVGLSDFSIMLFNWTG